MTAFSFLGELYLQNFYITIITKKKEEINTFIQHGCIQFIKRIKFIIKFIIHLKGYKLNAVILTFLFIKEFRKEINYFPKNINQHENQKSAY